jgi:hypothetical protein
MFRFTAILFLLMQLVAAQTVTVANYTDKPFEGWKHLTVDVKPPSEAGELRDTRYVLGREIGLDTYGLDLYTSLDPGQIREFDLMAFEAMPAPNPKLPADLIGYFGGIAMVNGTMMDLRGFEQDGPGFLAHFAARTGRMFHVDLFVRWFDGQPWAKAEAVITCSNPLVPDLSERTESGIYLTIGSSAVWPIGAPLNRLVAPGTSFADGQARMIPLTIIFPSAWENDSHILSARADGEFGICGIGIKDLLPDGNPIYPNWFNPISWANERFSESVRRLHTWDVGVVGPNRTSNDTGAQEDQIFKRGEALLRRGVGAEMIAYFGAAKLWNRPCHHLEADGSQLDPTFHFQRLILWDGRAHWHTGVSPDRLGKVGFLTPEMAAGWWGPDVEHWLISTLAAACRLTGSEGLQHLFSMHARIYPLQWTTTAGWSNSNWFAARAVGYELMNVVLIDKNLKDRVLAKKVRVNSIKRVEEIILPAFEGKDVWDARYNDPRLGSGWWWHPWQQSLAAYGLDLWGAQFGSPRARMVALRGANAVVNNAYAWQNGRWQNFAAVCLDGRVDNNPIFYFFGSPLASAVILRHDPSHRIAGEIWDQTNGDVSDLTHTGWLAPGIYR